MLEACETLESNEQLMSAEQSCPCSLLVTCSVPTAREELAWFSPEVLGVISLAGT